MAGAGHYRSYIGNTHVLGGMQGLGIRVMMENQMGKKLVK